MNKSIDIVTSIRVLNEKLHAITRQSGGLYFLDARGGTGKTFLLSLIMATICSQNKIALAIASSGIAATLLDGGRTAHSALEWVKYPNHVNSLYGTNVLWRTKNHWKRLIVH